METNRQKGGKEETFTQTSRRGRDRQLGGKDLQQGGSWRTEAGKVVAGAPGEVADGGAGIPMFE